MSDDSISRVAKAARSMRERRERLGWSTGYLASIATMHAHNQGDLTSISQQTISAFEQGRAKKMPSWFRYVEDAFTNEGDETDYPHVKRRAVESPLQQKPYSPKRTIWEETGEVKPWPEPWPGRITTSNNTFNQKISIPIFNTSRAADGAFHVAESVQTPEGHDDHIESFEDIHVRVQQFELIPEQIIGEFTRFPLTTSEAASSYGIYMPVQALERAVPLGAPTLVSRVRPPTEGDLVIMYLWWARPELPAADSQEDVVAVPAMLIRQSSVWYEGLQLHSEGRYFRVPADRVFQIHRIYQMADVVH
jgi:hypothetical protein